jgi:hypothetical protein
MTKRIHEKRNVGVTICLTDRQKAAIEELADGWDIDMATIGRRLIQLLLSKKASLTELLEKYHVVHASDNSTLEHAHATPASRRRKEYRISIRLTQDEKQELNIIAEEAFHLPGEMGGILIELFIAGVIKKSDIWR